jgi:hypothetical protein
MNRLKIRRLKIHVPARHFQRGMPENPLKPKHVAAIPNVVQRKRMAHRVEAKSDSSADS